MSSETSDIKTTDARLRLHGRLALTAAAIMLMLGLAQMAPNGWSWLPILAAVAIGWWGTRP